MDIERGAVELTTSSTRQPEKISKSVLLQQSSFHRKKGGRKPQSNPRGWSQGKTTEEELNAKPNRLININHEQDFDFCTNFVKTSKYEPYSFLPIFLWEEFNPKQKVANSYFLFIAILQVIPSITNTLGYPMMLLPLLFVVAVDAIFMIIEDVSRHRADRRSNSSVTAVWDAENKKFSNISWSEVQVGDILKIMNREAIPADILLLGVAEADPSAPTGVCYVETKSLDGETNLKIRQVTSSLVGIIGHSSEVGNLRGRIVMEHPNRLIHNFTGTVSIQDGPPEPIDPDGLILRGCTLRNTRYALGVVLNTGMDTKIMMSMTAAPTKTSRLSARVNSEIRNVAALMVTLCLLGAIASTVWAATRLDDAWYLQSPTDREDKISSGDLGVTFVVSFFYYVLLLGSFIPISLYVSMNFVRFFQSWFMNRDIEMYHEESDTPAQVRTMNLNEDLGQITHIFSDKTGTLTCNVMDFRKCSISGTVFGRGITEIGRTALEVAGMQIPDEVLFAEKMSQELSVPHVNFYDPSLFELLNSKTAENAKKLQTAEDFFTTLSICHTVIPEKLPSGEVVLSASSPDDEALVLGAKYFGFEFINRSDGCAVIRRKRIRDPGSEADLSNTNASDSDHLIRYQVLHVLPFNSDRKRMSVICRCPDGVIRIFSKGADTVMVPRIQSHTGKYDDPIDETISTTISHMDGFAQEGLRTLVIASAEIAEERYTSWSDMFEEASGNVEEISKKNAGLPNRIDDLMDAIEMGLNLLGATGIEDKLQDGVPSTIASIMDAGIKVWVLTGDKEETAINIAVACQLIWSEERMNRLVLNLKGEAKTTDELVEVLDSNLQAMVAEKEDFERDPNMFPVPLPQCLVIDGPALLELLRDPKGQCALLRFAQSCQSVVACRVTPDQKRAMVALVRRNVYGSRTLAIGDGANDVPMIQGAHVGVGISGQEGLQAVNSSDYAIAQFRFLRRLLLVHGRWNYRRSSRVVCYLFYKSVIFSTPLFYYAFYNGFSGTLYYDYVTNNLSAVVFTALPILLYGIYDRDVSVESCLTYPELYFEGIRDSWMTPKIFWSWMTQALIEGVWITLLPLYFMAGGNNTAGISVTYYDAGSVTFCLLIIISSLKMFWVQGRWSPIHKVVLAVSCGLWFLLSYLVSIIVLLNWEFYGVMAIILADPNFWLTIILCLSGVIIRDLTWKLHHRWWSPRLHHLIREYEAEGKVPPPLQALGHAFLTPSTKIYPETDPSTRSKITSVNTLDRPAGSPSAGLSIQASGNEPYFFKTSCDQLLGPQSPSPPHVPEYRTNSLFDRPRNDQAVRQGSLMGIFMSHRRSMPSQSSSPVVFVPGPWSGSAPNDPDFLYGEDAVNSDFSRRLTLSPKSMVHSNGTSSRDRYQRSESGNGFAYSCDRRSQQSEIQRIMRTYGSVGTLQNPTVRASSLISRQHSEQPLRRGIAMPKIPGSKEGSPLRDGGDKNA